MVLEPAGRQYVSRAASQGLLASLEQLPGEPLHGFFGPGSVTWRVNRESAVFLGAGRAALLQLAHPWVAAALTQHSNLLHDAVGRFHSTFRVIYTMLFGTRAQALEAARQLYQRHTGIRGELPHPVGAYAQGEHYEANEVAALRWVHATLVESAMLAYEFVLPLSPADREQYYSESQRMAVLFGIPAEALPRDWTAFVEYTAEMFDSPQLCVDAGALALGRSVMSGGGSRLHPPHWYQAITAHWMPVRLRTAFELPFGAPEKQAVSRAARWLPRLYPHLPGDVAICRPVSRSRRSPARSQARRPHTQKQPLLDGPASVAICEASGISDQSSHPLCASAPLRTQLLIFQQQLTNQQLQPLALICQCRQIGLHPGYPMQSSARGIRVAGLGDPRVPQTSSITRAAASIASATLRICSVDRFPRSVRIFNA